MVVARSLWSPSQWSLAKRASRRLSTQDEVLTCMDQVASTSLDVLSRPNLNFSQTLARLLLGRCMARHAIPRDELPVEAVYAWVFSKALSRAQSLLCPLVGRTPSKFEVFATLRCVQAPCRSSTCTRERMWKLGNHRKQENSLTSRSRKAYMT
jgi:hypothetical protein